MLIALQLLLICQAYAAINSPEIDFMWGVATAAYQIEGATDVDGRGPSIWDEFVSLPNKTKLGDNGNMADQSYYMYDVDTQLTKDLGVKYYRFSIAWSRILPDGIGRINRAGIDHYNDVIDSLVTAGISPIVTLYHWDLPLSLEKKYGGWLSPDMELFFVEYAKVCFSEFGDRVKYWITVNEPWTFTLNGYVSGVHAPGRCSDRLVCAQGDSATEAYLVAHNVLNAHAAVVDVYRSLYQDHQVGQIGITLNIDWSYPLNPNSLADQAAASRRNEFTFGWFADPIFFGDYPASMRSLVGDRLPVFTESQRNRLVGSTDFIGFNHYSSWFVSDSSSSSVVQSVNLGAGWFGDQQVSAGKLSLDGKLIGPQGGSPWLNSVPDGMYRALMWVYHRYDNPIVIVTENGCDIEGENDQPMPQALQDNFRVDYFRQYIREMFRARANGADIRGYMAWSLLDNFEWSDGYSMRFGLYHVDYSNPLRPRVPKLSALWFRDYVRNYTANDASATTPLPETVEWSGGGGRWGSDRGRFTGDCFPAPPPSAVSYASSSVVTRKHEKYDSIKGGTSRSARESGFLSISFDLYWCLLKKFYFMGTGSDSRQKNKTDSPLTVYTQTSDSDGRNWNLGEVERDFANLIRHPLGVP